MAQTFGGERTDADMLRCGRAKNEDINRTKEAAASENGNLVD